MAAIQNELEAVKKERDELDRECNQLHEKHGLAVLNIQKLEEKIELLEGQIAIFPSEQALTTSEHLEEIERLRQQVEELPRQGESTAPARDLSDVNLLEFLERLRAKHPLFKSKSKKLVSNDKETQIILDVLEELL